MSVEAGDRCSCGGLVEAALRYSDTGSPQEVLVCWSCGGEEPPLYAWSRRLRVDAWTVCGWCSMSFQPSRRRPEQVYCSPRCRAYGVHAAKGVA